MPPSFPRAGVVLAHGPLLNLALHPIIYIPGPPLESKRKKRIFQSENVLVYILPRSVNPQRIGSRAERSFPTGSSGAVQRSIAASVGVPGRRARRAQGCCMFELKVSETHRWHMFKNVASPRFPGSWLSRLHLQHCMVASMSRVLFPTPSMPRARRRSPHQNRFPTTCQTPRGIAHSSSSSSHLRFRLLAYGSRALLTLRPCASLGNPGSSVSNPSSRRRLYTSHACRAGWPGGNGHRREVRMSIAFSPYCLDLTTANASRRTSSPNNSRGTVLDLAKVCVTASTYIVNCPSSPM